MRRPNVQQSLGELPEGKKQLDELKELQKKMAGLERWNTQKSENNNNLGTSKKVSRPEKDKLNSSSLIDKLQQWWSSLFGSSATP